MPFITSYIARILILSVFDLKGNAPWPMINNSPIMYLILGYAILAAACFGTQPLVFTPHRDIRMGAGIDNRLRHLRSCFATITIVASESSKTEAPALLRVLYDLQVQALSSSIEPNGHGKTQCT